MSTYAPIISFKGGTNWAVRLEQNPRGPRVTTMHSLQSVFSGAFKSTIREECGWETKTHTELILVIQHPARTLVLEHQKNEVWSTALECKIDRTKGAARLCQER